MVKINLEWIYYRRLTVFHSKLTVRHRSIELLFERNPKWPVALSVPENYYHKTFHPGYRHRRKHFFFFWVFRCVSLSILVLFFLWFPPNNTLDPKRKNKSNLFFKIYLKKKKNICKFYFYYFFRFLFLRALLSSALRTNLLLSSWLRLSSSTLCVLP